MSYQARAYNRDFFPVEGGRIRAQQNDTVTRLARLLDAQWNLPFGTKIGWDGVLGFVPGIGDLATNFLSLYIVLQAALLGCPPIVILRMGMNILIDNFFDAIPILGNFFDFFWKSNTRNVRLIEAYQANPRRAMVRSRWAVGTGIALVALFAIASLTIAVFAFFTAVQWIVGLLT